MALFQDCPDVLLATAKGVTRGVLMDARDIASEIDATGLTLVRTAGVSSTSTPAETMEF